MKPLKDRAIPVSLACLAMLLAQPSRAGQEDRERLLEIARGADALDLIASCEDSEMMLMYAELAGRGANIVGPDGKALSGRKARQLAGEHRLKQEVCRQVMAERGQQDLAGAYAFATLGDCGAAQSMWAELGSDPACRGPVIEQDGQALTFHHACNLDGQALDFTFAGKTFGDAVLIVDEMNSDYRYMGRIQGGVLRFEIDADRALGSWPDWSGPPPRAALRSCRIVLTPSAPATPEP